MIESAGAKTGKAHVIKCHHNVGGLPERMKLKLVEPLRELFKDEVRAHRPRARPAARRWSTAIRSRARAWACASSARSRRRAPTLLRLADHIFIEELRRAGWYDKISQAFAVFLPVKIGRRHGRRPPPTNR